MLPRTAYMKANLHISTSRSQDLESYKNPVSMLSFGYELDNNLVLILYFCSLWDKGQ